MAERPPNRCIYCEGTGVSKEHYWGRWCGKYRLSACEKTVHTTDWAGELDAKERSGDPISQTIRKVCRECNNGWLNEVDQRADKVIEHILVKNRTSITPQQQLELATWVVTNSMSWEFRHEQTRSTPQSERNFVRAHLLPPPTWTVWMGVGDGTFCGDILRAVVGDPFAKPFNIAQVTTIGLNKLVFHSFSTAYQTHQGLESVMQRKGLAKISTPRADVTHSMVRRRTFAQTEDLHYEIFDIAFGCNLKASWKRTDRTGHWKTE